VSAPVSLPSLWNQELSDLVSIFNWRFLQPVLHVRFLMEEDSFQFTTADSVVPFLLFGLDCLQQCCGCASAKSTSAERRERGCVLQNRRTSSSVAQPLLQTPRQFPPARRRKGGRGRGKEAVVVLVQATAVLVEVLPPADPAQAGCHDARAPPWPPPPRLDPRRGRVNASHPFQSSDGGSAFLLCTGPPAPPH
jgi:hypothetical protein